MKDMMTLEQFNETYEGSPLPENKLSLEKDNTMNTTINTRNSFAAIKAKRDAMARDKKAKAVAFAQHFATAADQGDLVQIIGVACNIPDQSKLGKQLAFNMSRAAGNQLIQYLKRDADEVPQMSIGEIRGVESACRLDLLENTLTFLGADTSDLRPGGKLKPQRPMVSAGGMNNALFILTAEALAMMDNHPKDGYKGLDGDLANALNTILECGLPVGEQAQRAYDWDVDPFEQADEAARYEDRSDKRDEEYSWDEVPEDEKTSAVAGIHW